MPFLRFSKDRRGYESTFLLHAHRAGERDAVLLYWFRTPPHVKMGRAALDEETIRVLEDTHPAVDFDWPRILASRPQPSEPPPDVNRPSRVRRRAEREERREERGGRAARPAFPGRFTPTVQRPAEAPVPVAVPVAPAAPPPQEQPPKTPIAEAPPEPVEVEAPVRKFIRVFDAPVVQAVEPDEPAAPPQGGRLSEPSASERALGSEQLERLRGRYAAVMARIARRVTDRPTADRLRAIAERANPDNWVTDEDVRTGLDGLNDVYAELVPHVGRRRRRRRSGRGPSLDSIAPASGEEPHSTTPLEDDLTDDDTPESDD